MFRKALSSNYTEELLKRILGSLKEISVSVICVGRLSSVIRVMGTIRLNEGVELTSIRSFPGVMGNSD
jgi:hypothetical protein